MNKIKHVLLLLFFASTFINAQDSLHKRPFWLSVGLGGSPEYYNASYSFNKAFEKFSYHISINGTVEHDAILGGENMETGTFGLGFSDIKIWNIISIYAGPSVSAGKGKTKSGESLTFWGAGFSLCGQVYFMPLYKLFPGLGIGIELFYNYNAMQTESVNYRNVYVLRLSGIITNLHDK